jgi:hypothetical protein
MSTRGSKDLSVEEEDDDDDEKILALCFLGNRSSMIAPFADAPYTRYTSHNLNRYCRF